MFYFYSDGKFGSLGLYSNTTSEHTRQLSTDQLIEYKSCIFPHSDGAIFLKFRSLSITYKYG